MHEHYGQCRGALVILHGGAGGQDPRGPGALERATAALRQMAAEATARLREGLDPLEVVVHCLQAMEADEQFNAGRGAALQADGQARLTAALMDGAKCSFSGVISASYVKHPVLLARFLQGQSSRVLTSPGTELLARQLGLPVESALTPERLKKWTARAEAGESFCDTVGAVVRTADGRLFVGTSTGGRGFEYPGRVSDSATVAGTYGSPWAAVSATGVGEEIVDDAVAARLETRCRDGASLEAASRRCFQEARERRRLYGWIAADREGHWAVAYTTAAMSYVVQSVDQGLVAASVSA